MFCTKSLVGFFVPRPCNRKFEKRFKCGHDIWLRSNWQWTWDTFNVKENKGKTTHYGFTIHNKS